VEWNEKEIEGARERKREMILKANLYSLNGNILLVPIPFDH